MANIIHQKAKGKRTLLLSAQIEIKLQEGEMNPLKTNI